jgi:hypothetical protein
MTPLDFPSLPPYEGCGSGDHTCGSWCLPMANDKLILQPFYGSVFLFLRSKMVITYRLFSFWGGKLISYGNCCEMARNTPKIPGYMAPDRSC